MFAIIQEQGLELEQLRATGGGAKSLVWRQILADVLGVQLVTTTAGEGPAFGAALLAGVASGVYASVQQACEATVRVVEHTEPRPELESVYARAYEKYRALYPTLKPISIANYEQFCYFLKTKTLFQMDSRNWVVLFLQLQF